MSHGVSISTPLRGSMVTTARTRPASSPSNRTSSPNDALAGHVGRWRADGDGSTEVDPGAMRLLRRARGQQTGQVVAGAGRVDLRGTGRDDDLVGTDVEHPAAGPDDDRGTGVDRHDLVAVGGIEDQDVAAAGARRLGGG